MGGVPERASGVFEGSRRGTRPPHERMSSGEFPKNGRKSLAPFCQPLRGIRGYADVAAGRVFGAWGERCGRPPLHASETYYGSGVRCTTAPRMHFARGYFVSSVARPQTPLLGAPDARRLRGRGGVFVPPPSCGFPTTSWSANAHAKGDFLGPGSAIPETASRRLKTTPLGVFAPHCDRRRVGSSDGCPMHPRGALRHRGLSAQKGTFAGPLRRPTGGARGGIWGRGQGGTHGR